MKTKLFHAGRSTLSVVLAVMMLLSTMLIGSLSSVTAASTSSNDSSVGATASEEVGATIPAGTTIYLDISSAKSGNDYNFSDSSNVWMSVVSSTNQNYSADSSNTSNAGSYSPKSDTWIQMTQVNSSDVYQATVTTESTVGKVSFYNKDMSSYDNIWESACVLAQTYDGTNNLFTLGSSATKHDSRSSSLYSGTWSTYSASTTTNVASNVSLTASPTSPEAGSSVTLTAAATLADGVSNPTYTFCEGTTQLQSSTSNTCTVSSITAGSHTYKVTVSADGYNSMSATTTVTATSSSSSTPHIYLADSANWGSAYAYAWNGSTTYTDNWPGSAMTLDSTYTASKGVSVYAYELNSSATGNIIFVKENNGSQTTNLTLPDDWTTTDYIYDNSTGKWSTLADYVYTDTTTYDYYIVGNTLGGWNMSNTSYGMSKDSFTGYYYAKVNLTQNESYFRFTNGTTWYGAQNKDTEISNNATGKIVSENTENVWKYTGTTGKATVWYNTSTGYTWIDEDVEQSASTDGDIFMTTNTSTFDDATAVNATVTENSDGTVTFTKEYTVGTSGDLTAGTYVFAFSSSDSISNMYATGEIDQSGQISGDIDVDSQYASLSGRDSWPKGMKVTLSEDATLLTVTVTKATDGSITYYATGTATASAKLIAKNGTIRTSGGDYDSITDDMGTTTVSYNYTYITDGVTISDGTARKVVKMSTEAIKKGLTLTITTTMNSEYSDKYYVAGWVVNGETYGLQESAIEAGGSGAETTVSFDYTVPVDTAADNVIEVTPVYYMKSLSTVRFYVEDYENVKGAWGNTLACYAYYSTGDGAESFNEANGFGCYPGQPMLQTGGRYFYELPTSITGSDGNTYTVKGVTLNNYMWDDVHKSLVGSTNYQTYDYSDFASIYNNIVSKQTKSTDIIFAFKYTAEAKGTDHFGDGVTIADGSSETTPSSAQKSDDTLGNVTENLTDFYGNRVDLFHTNIENSSTVSNTPWIAISNGYEDCKNTINGEVGYYATRWAIYKPTDSGYTFVTAINSASLFYSSADDLTTAGYTTEADAYTALVNAGAKNQPVVISYEKEITRGTSLAGTTAGGSGQTGARSDGVWYYSIADTTVTAHTAVQYAQTYSSTGYSDSDYTTDWYLSTTTSGWDYEDTANYDPNSTEYYKGRTTGLEAYFNFSADDGTNFWHKTAATLSTESTKKFVFYAQPKTYNGKTYQFDGWYLYNASSDTYTLISTEQNYYTKPVNNDLYVARFSPVPTEGALTVNHYFDSANSTGTAEVNVKVEVVDTDNNVKYTNSGTNTATVPQSTGWINSGSENNVVITLTTTPGTGVTFKEFEELVNSKITSLGTSETDLVVKTSSSITYNNSDGTYTATITFPVKSLFSGSEQTISSLTYYSKTSVDFKLQIDYTYKTRYYGTKVYQVISDNYYESVNSAADTVTLDSEFAGKYIVSDGNGGYKVTTDCITEYAPDVTNFNQNISWDVDDTSKVSQTYDSSTGLIKVTITATQPDAYVRYATIEYVDPDTNSEKTVDNAESTYQKDGSSDTQDISTADYHWYKDATSKTFYETATKNSSGKKFSYWVVYNKSDYEKNSSNASVVTYIYSRYFNYTAFDNYYVEAVYGADDETTSEVKSTSATVAELADTRNHWNNTTTGENDSSILYNTAQKEYDRLYIDFALSYKIFENGEEVILNDGTNVNSKYKVGFVIAGESVDKSVVESTITNGKSTSGSAIYVEVNNNNLTNKNRIEYCYGVKKSDTSVSTKYKVYAFVYDGTTVTLSDAITVCYGNCLDSTNTAYQTTTNS